MVSIRTWTGTAWDKVAVIGHGAVDSRRQRLHRLSQLPSVMSLLVEPQ